MTAPAFIYTSEPWAALSFGRPIFAPAGHLPQSSSASRLIAAVIAFAFAASVARAEIQTLQMNPDARGGGLEPADVHRSNQSSLRGST
jgi:hypothetical protein